MTTDGRVGLALREDPNDREHLVRIIESDAATAGRPFMARSSMPGTGGCTWIATANLSTSLSPEAEALKDRQLSNDAAAEERKALRYAAAVASPKAQCMCRACDGGAQRPDACMNVQHYDSGSLRSPRRTFALAPDPRGRPSLPLEESTRPGNASLQPASGRVPVLAISQTLPYIDQLSLALSVT